MLDTPKFPLPNYLPDKCEHICISSLAEWSLYYTLNKYYNAVGPYFLLAKMFVQLPLTYLKKSIYNFIVRLNSK